MPPSLLLAAGDAAWLGQQLGLADGDEVEPLDVDQLPLSPALRQQVRDWADAFLDLHRAGRLPSPGRLPPPGRLPSHGGLPESGELPRPGAPDENADLGELGIGLASALAAEWGPDVRLRYLAHSVMLVAASRPLFDQPIAGVFADPQALEVIPMRTGWTAYQSTLALEFGRGAGQEVSAADPWSTASATDATHDLLRELRRRAVDQVVRSLLTPDELESSTVVVYQQDGTREIAVWLQAMGEEMRHWIHDPDVAGELPDVGTIAERFADSMEDWVCETRFGWGQRRIARYRIPPG